MYIQHIIYIKRTNVQDGDVFCGFLKHLLLLRKINSLFCDRPICSNRLDNLDKKGNFKQRYEGDMLPLMVSFRFPCDWMSILFANMASCLSALFAVLCIQNVFALILDFFVASVTMILSSNKCTVNLLTHRVTCIN